MGTSWQRGCHPDETQTLADQTGMGLEGLTAAHGRIAQIRSLINATIPHGSASVGASRTSVAAASPGSTNFNADTAFEDLLDEVSKTTGASAATAPAATGTGRGAKHDRFARDVLAGIGAPTTAENIRGLKAWALAEGTKALNNPLATTRKYANTSNFNSVGVKNYASYEDGVAATIETLKNGRYPNILAALAQGNSAEAIGVAVAQSPWGTGQGVLRVLRQGDV